MWLNVGAKDIQLFCSYQLFLRTGKCYHSWGGGGGSKVARYLFFFCGVFRVFKTEKNVI